ncbi:hypothetical protein FACS189467_1350 [Bacteroidia bacterium]|nr:hypothetical protein FACS189467_1350 [Bacteroidia bacterium]
MKKIYLLIGALACAFAACDSGDIYPADRTNKGDNIAVAVSFRLSARDKIPAGYSLVFGAFEENSSSPLVWTSVMETAGDEPVRVSLSSVPKAARTVKLSLFTVGRKAIYDFYTFDISTALEAIEIPLTDVSLLLKYNKIQEIFGKNCTACHGTERGGGGLLLGDGVSYAALVNQAATNSEKVRVEPYSVQNSFLMDVLTDEAIKLSQPHSTILYADDINLLKAWIAAGAEHN